MSSPEEGSSRAGDHHVKYRGVRCRKWGKWVSEIRVPGTQDRLWLGSYRTPEAAAVAHDIASYCLRGDSSLGKLNFPLKTLPASVQADMSPRSVQKVASDAGMAVDAQFAKNQLPADDDSHDANTSDGNSRLHDEHFGNWERSSELIGHGGEALNVSVEDYL